MEAPVPPRRRHLTAVAVHANGARQTVKSLAPVGSRTTPPAVNLSATVVTRLPLTVSWVRTSLAKDDHPESVGRRGGREPERDLGGAGVGHVTLHLEPTGV